MLVPILLAALLFKVAVRDVSKVTLGVVGVVDAALIVVVPLIGTKNLQNMWYSP